jgi:hypothetical protein
MIRAIAILSAFALCGCASREAVQFAPRTGQQGMVRDGVPALVSRGGNSIVTIRPAGRGVSAFGRPVFLVGIQNLSRQPLDFRMANVSVVQVVAGQPMGLKVYTFEELDAEARREQIVTALLVGAAAGANSAAASRQGYVAQAVAANQNADLAETAAIAGQAKLAALEAFAIKDNTLMPGEVYGGQLHIDRPSSNAGKAYSITIHVGPDRHDLNVQQGG